MNWTIGDLPKQKYELEGKLHIARKHYETGALIEEVHAPKHALDKRIGFLQDGLKASYDLVDDQVDELEKTVFTVDEKLEVAQERLEALEQEAYLEQIGRKLSGDFSTEDADADDSVEKAASQGEFSREDGTSSPS